MSDPLSPGAKGRCPHCKLSVRFEFPEDWKIKIASFRPIPFMSLTTEVRAHVASCPDCNVPVIDLVWMDIPNYGDGDMEVTKVVRAYPEHASARLDPPPEVPEAIRIDYREAAAVEPISRRAAAALARRCLQSTLHHLGFKAKNLFREIELVDNDPRASSQLRQSLHMVREIGNYAAHPLPDGNGDFLNVEPGEVDALFDTLDDLFDNFFVKPRQQQERKDRLNAKLTAAGRNALP
ncbi:DUF4145 domain-containing protein [Cystobacter fuscus]